MFVMLSVIKLADHELATERALSKGCLDQSMCSMRKFTCPNESPVATLRPKVQSGIRDDDWYTGICTCPQVRLYPIKALISFS